MELWTRMVMRKLQVQETMKVRQRVTSLQDLEVVSPSQDLAIPSLLSSGH